MRQLVTGRMPVEVFVLGLVFGWSKPDGGQAVRRAGSFSALEPLRSSGHWLCRNAPATLCSAGWDCCAADILVPGHVGGDSPVLIHTFPGGLVLTKETAPESHQKSEMNCQKEIREQNDPSLLHLLVENET